MKSEDLSAIGAVTLSFVTREDASSIDDIDPVVGTEISAHQVNRGPVWNDDDLQP